MAQRYRLATLDDAEALLDVIVRAYAQNLELGIKFDATTADLPMVQKHIQTHMCYLYEEDDKLVATVSLRMPWGPNPGPAGVPHIGWFAVDPLIEKKGVGTQLLNWLEETVLREELKVPFVTLGTADKHPWLGKMYEKKGYVKFDERDLGKGHITHYFKKVIREDLLK